MGKRGRWVWLRWEKGGGGFRHLALLDVDLVADEDDGNVLTDAHLPY